MKIHRTGVIKTYEDIERLFIEFDCNELIFSKQNYKKFEKIFIDILDLYVLTNHNSIYFHGNMLISMRNIPSGIFIIKNSLFEKEPLCINEKLKSKIKFDLL